MRTLSASRDLSLKRLPSTSGSSFSSSAFKSLRPSFNKSESDEKSGSEKKVSCEEDDYINDQLIEDPTDESVGCHANDFFFEEEIIEHSIPVE
jgi:hypothetical protein